MITYMSGDEILITCDSKTIPGTVVMISTNQVSAMIKFDAVLNGHAGMMAVQRHDLAKGIYRSIINGTEVTFQKKS